MAKKKAATAKPTRPRSFNGVIKGRTRAVQNIAKALRDIVFAELPDAEESYIGGQNAMALYRTTADVCWLQPLKARCNIYFLRGPELTDDEQLLEGNSDRYRFARVHSLEDVEQLPIRAWLQETVALNEAANEGLSFDEVLQRLQKICLALPNTKETNTWGKPHFRVGEKIFCGCGEDQGRPRVGLKMEPQQSRLMMRLPGIEKAPYSRPNDGWVSIDPGVFDDWPEIQRAIIDSYRLIAPKRTVALLDEQREGAKPRRKSVKRR